MKELLAVAAAEAASNEERQAAALAQQRMLDAVDANRELALTHVTFIYNDACWAHDVLVYSVPVLNSGKPFASRVSWPVLDFCFVFRRVCAGAR